MEQQTEGKATFPPFAEQLIERGFREGELKGIREGKLDGIREGELRGKRDGIREGELKGKRDALLRLLTRAGIALTEDERARIQGCADPALLDRWVDNVLGAKTASDVLS
jgi:flagellar biosynthesis/type III secretory pathway protein FliH